MNRLGMLVDLSHVSPGGHERRARRRRGAGHLLPLRRPGADRSPAQRSRLDSGAAAEERRGGDGHLRPAVRVGGVSRPGRRRPMEQWKAIKAAVSRHGRATAADRGVEGARTRAPSATLEQVADHIEHVRQGGRRGSRRHRQRLRRDRYVPEGLEDVSKFPDLFAELIRRGWSDGDLKKLAGQNLLRAMRAAEATAARLQRTREPSTKTIEELDARPPGVLSRHRQPRRSARARPRSPGRRSAPRTLPPAPRIETTVLHRPGAALRRSAPARAAAEMAAGRCRGSA